MMFLQIHNDEILQNEQADKQSITKYKNRKNSYFLNRNTS